MQPESQVPFVLNLIDVTRRRRIGLDVMLAVSAAGALIVVGSWLLMPFVRPALAVSAAVAAGLSAGSGFLWLRRRQWTTTAVARRIEAIQPGARNLVVTAEELRRHPDRASTWMSAVVMEQAAHAIHDVKASDAVPAARALAAAAASTAVSLAVILAPAAARVANTVVDRVQSAVSNLSPSGEGRIEVVVRPPSYSGMAATTIADPQRLEVLEGTQLLFTRSGGGGWRLRFGQRTMGSAESGKHIEHTARASGYIVIEPADGADRRLIVLSVRPDSAPSVRIDQPARDLLLPSVSGSVPVAVSATDDLGLASFELRYTKMSGSGEQFDFLEGRLPLRIERTTARDWRGRAEIPLPELRLNAGDSIVYYAAATDLQPDARAATSDTFFVEIAGPGQVPIETVGLPPEEDRYALSQQMIVLKIERLQARERTLGREQFVEEAGLIAAEQRSVRANFTFLLGGHVEDEEVEAEQESEIAEGRLLNTARRDITLAIRDMTRAEQGLTAIDTRSALAAARSAVKSLQRAFGRSRYFLRSLASSGHVDPSRRLTGRLEATGGWKREVIPLVADAGIEARSLLADLVQLSDALAAGSVSADAPEEAAERALSIGPSSATWQNVSQRLLRVRDVLKDPVAAQSILREVVVVVRQEADRGLLPRTTLSKRDPAIVRAWEGRGKR